MYYTNLIIHNGMVSLKFRAINTYCYKVKNLVNGNEELSRKKLQ